MDLKISVIIPCYNQAHFLPDSLNCILNQTHKNWECIIVNDGSIDTTEEVSLSWCKKDIRFIYLNKINGGLSSARNAGLNKATGDFIQFLDADDVIDFNKFELQLQLLEKNNGLSLAYSDYFCCDENDTNKRIEQYLPPRFKTNNYLIELISDWEVRLSIPCHCFLFDSRFFNDYKIRFDETLPNHEDWDCWMNIFKLNPSIFFVDKELAIYRIRTVRMSSDILKMRKGFLKAIAKQKKNLKNNKQLSNLLSNRYSIEKWGINGRRKPHNRIIRFLKRKLKIS